MNRLINVIAKYLIIGWVLLFFSCSKDDDKSSQSSNYPRQVSVTYKVSSTSLSIADVGYINETGGDTDLANISLPFETTIQKTVNYGDLVRIDGYYYNSSQVGVAKDIKAEIWIDGNLVKTETGNSNSESVNVFLMYQFQ